MRAVALAVLLAGCASAAPPSPPAAACGLLPMRGYDAAFNARLADEMAAAPPGAAWVTAIRDYVELRDAVKACAR